MTRLANGMTVLVRESRAAPVVAISLLVAAGSLYETPETSGSTALLGRVLVKGTRTRSALDVARAAEDAGGAIETASDQEYAQIQAYGLGRHWPDLLGLVHEVATAPSLAEAEVEREREVLLAQIRGLEDQPFQVANRVLGRALYGNHAYGLPTSGDAVSVARLGRDDLARHFARCYTPSRMVLGVAGAVVADEVRAEASRLFEGLPAGPTAPAVGPLPSSPARERDGETRPIQQTQILMGFLAPPIGHRDHVPIKVMAAVLGGGMSSRLFRTLRDAEGLAYSVGAAYPTRRGTGRVVVHIGTAPENAEAAEAGLRREIARLAAGPVPDDEVARTRTYLAGAFVLDSRTSARRSFLAAFYELMGMGAGYEERYPALIGAVTARDVQRVAAQYLVDASVAVVGPG